MEPIGPSLCHQALCLQKHYLAWLRSRQRLTFWTSHWKFGPHFFWMSSKPQRYVMDSTIGLSSNCRVSCPWVHNCGPLALKGNIPKQLSIFPWCSFDTCFWYKSLVEVFLHQSTAFGLDWKWQFDFSTMHILCLFVLFLEMLRKIKCLFLSEKWSIVPKGKRAIPSLSVTENNCSAAPDETFIHKFITGSWSWVAGLLTYNRIFRTIGHT